MCVNPALYLGYKFGHHAISRMNFNESQHYFLTSADRDITEFMDEYISYNRMSKYILHSTDFSKYNNVVVGICFISSYNTVGRVLFLFVYKKKVF